MARSDDRQRRRRRLGLGLALLVGVAGTSGCSTTQQEASRLQLNDARIRAGQLRTVVRRAGDRVQVGHVTLLRTPRGSAFVVTVRNPSPAAVIDLPISVGVGERSSSRSRPLNAVSSAEFSYFDAHLPLIPARGQLTWVFTTDRRLGRRARPYARIGARPSPATRATGAGPTIQARRVAAAGAALTVALRNTSSIPQYQLQVYAVGRRAGRPVLAGALTVVHLGSHATLRARVPVIGSLTGGSLSLAAVPTIVH